MPQSARRSSAPVARRRGIDSSSPRDFRPYPIRFRSRRIGDVADRNASGVRPLRHLIAVFPFGVGVPGAVVSLADGVRHGANHESAKAVCAPNSRALRAGLGT
jgi:hypothetical protein